MLTKEKLEEFIVRAEQVQYVAAEARRAADEAARRAREARDAAERAEQAAEALATEMGAVWREMNGE